MRITSVKSKWLSEIGLTLMELLVVVGILTALAGVVSIAVTQFIGRGHAEAAATELHNIQTVVAAYIAKNSGQIPADTAALVNAGLLLTTPHGTYIINPFNGQVIQTSFP